MADMRAMQGHSHLTILKYLFDARRVLNNNDEAELMTVATVSSIQASA